MINIIYIYILFLFFNCASQGLPQGGPKDVDGPMLLSIEPLNEDDISQYDKIILEFNERLNPNSIINAVSIYPETDVMLSTKGNRLIIDPLSSWPLNGPIEVHLNRNISDFHSNKINKEIQLIYNIDDDINYCSIDGELFNSLDKLYNIYIYEWPVDDFDNPLKKINSDINSRFFINYLKPGKYAVVASNGRLDIYNNSYGFAPYEYIDIDSTNCIKYIPIYIDKPLEKKKITRVETITSDFLNIFYDNNIIEPYFLDKNINFGDTVLINIKTNNRLENYNIPPYSYIKRDILDTIRPFISSINSLDSNTIINFSEPINKDSLIILGLENHNENIWKNTEYINISPNSIQLNNSKLFKIKILGSSVQDFNQNTILDSVKVYILDDSPIENKGMNSLRGNILNSFNGSVVVEAKNISLDLLYHDVVEDSLFEFKNIHPGKYILRAYEEKNDIDSLIYFSGTINPYKNAAKFSVYNDTIEVRKFWDIEGINIKFREE